MPTDREIQAFKATVHRQAREERESGAPASSPKKRGDGIDRPAMWARAHERARTMPAVRIDVE
jgi:hypothetical protein